MRQGGLRGRRGGPPFDAVVTLHAGGTIAGWQTISHTLTLSDATHSTWSGTNAFYTTAGTLCRTGCSTAVAERIMEP